MKLVFKINGEKPNPYFGVVEGYILEGINQISLIELILVSEFDLCDKDCADYIGSSVTIALADTVEDELHRSRFDGIIYEFHVLTLAGDNDIFVKYQMVVRPRLWELNFKVQARSFPDKTKVEVLDQVFKEWSLIKGRDYEICLFKQNGSAYPKITQIVQNQVSDLVFVQNLMKEAGINYYFAADKIEDKPEMLRLFDHNGFLGEPFNMLKKSPNKKKAVPYKLYAGIPGADTFKHRIESLERHFRASIMDTISYADFGDGIRESFQSDLTSVDNGYAGMMVSYGCCGESKDVANREATRRAEYLKSNQVTYEGRSNFFMFRPGEKYPIGDGCGKPRKNEMNILLTSVFHHFNQNIPSAFTGNQELEYSNMFFAVNKDAPYRPDQTSEKSIVEMKRAFTHRHSACAADDVDPVTRTDIENVEIYNLKRHITELKHELSIARDLTGIMVGEVIRNAWVTKHNELLCRVKNEKFPEGITIKVALGWLSLNGWLCLLPRIGMQVYFQFLNGEGGQNEAIMVGYRSNEGMPVMDPEKTTDCVTLGKGDDPILCTVTDKVVNKAKFSPKNRYRNALLGELGVAEVAVIDSGEDSVYLHANNRICVVGDKQVNIKAGALNESAGEVSQQYGSLCRGVSGNEKVSIKDNVERTVGGSSVEYSEYNMSVKANQGYIDMSAKSEVILKNEKKTRMVINDDTISILEDGGNSVGVTPKGILCSTNTGISVSLLKEEKQAEMKVAKSFVLVQEKDVSVNTETTSAVFGSNGAGVKTDKAVSFESSGGATITMADGEIRLNC